MSGAVCNTGKWFCNHKMFQENLSVLLGFNKPLFSYISNCYCFVPFIYHTRQVDTAFEDLYGVFQGEDQMSWQTSKISYAECFSRA